jgi:hypothetical protein
MSQEVFKFPIIGPNFFGLDSQSKAGLKTIKWKDNLKYC